MANARTKCMFLAFCAKKNHRSFVSQCSELANCYCYAIVKREICLGPS